MKSRLYKKYTDEVVPALKAKHNFKNLHQIPKLTKIVVNISTLTDDLFERSCNGEPANGPADRGPTMTWEELEREQYERLTPEEKASQDAWKDPPKKLTN